MLSELDKNFSDIRSPLLGFIMTFFLSGYNLSATSFIFIKALELTIYLPDPSLTAKSIRPIDSSIEIK